MQQKLAVDGDTGEGSGGTEVVTPGETTEPEEPEIVNVSQPESRNRYCCKISKE